MEKHPFKKIMIMQIKVKVQTKKRIKIKPKVVPKKCNLIVKIFYNQLNLILIFYLKVNLYFHLIGESKLLL